MSKTFTDLYVRNLKPDPGGRIEIPDGGQRGLYLVVQAVRHEIVGDQIPAPARPQAEEDDAAIRLVARGRRGRSPPITCSQLAQGIDPIAAKKAKDEAGCAERDRGDTRCGRLPALSCRSRGIEAAVPRPYTRPRSRITSYRNWASSQIAELKRDRDHRACSITIAAEVRAFGSGRGEDACDHAQGHELASDAHQRVSSRQSSRHELAAQAEPIALGTHVPIRRRDQARLGSQRAIRTHRHLRPVSVRLMILCRRTEKPRRRRLRRSRDRDRAQTTAIDFTVWRLPTSRSKNKQPSIVRPLSPGPRSTIIEDAARSIGDRRAASCSRSNGRSADQHELSGQEAAARRDSRSVKRLAAARSAAHRSAPCCSAAVACRSRPPSACLGHSQVAAHAEPTISISHLRRDAGSVSRRWPPRSSASSRATAAR